MEFTLTKLIHRRYVYSSSRRSIIFSGHYHSKTPCCWFAMGNTFEYSHFHISKKILFHLFLPMQGNGCRLSETYWFRFGVDMNLNWGALYFWQFLVFAFVECRGGITVQNPFLHFIDILGDTIKWEFCRFLWRLFSFQTSAWGIYRATVVVCHWGQCT